MKFTLVESEFKKWLHNMLVFLAPLIILYITSIIGIISQPFHTFILMDLVPNSFAAGGLVLWILNAVLDYFRKLQVV